MTKAKYVVGGTLVTAHLDDAGRVTVTDEEDEWTPTLEQIEEHYTEVDEMAERFIDLAKQKRRQHKDDIRDAS